MISVSGLEAFVDIVSNSGISRFIQAFNSPAIKIITKITYKTRLIVLG